VKWVAGEPLWFRRAYPRRCAPAGADQLEHRISVRVLCSIAVRSPFVQSVLEDLLADGALRAEDSILAVCAGAAERDVFVQLGLTNAIISNVATPTSDEEFSPLGWSYQDATNLTFDDDSFDFAFVADGLHHTAAPHRAVLEMYRVARAGIVVIESRHSLLMRLANRLRLTPEYELDAVIDNDFRRGGLNNTDIPNYVYRWTEAEFAKTIRAFNPIGNHRFRFFYALNLPYAQAEMKNNSSFMPRMLRLIEPLLRLFTHVFKKQCNSFAMVAFKPRVPEDLWPWLTVEEAQIRFNPDYADSRSKLRSPT
jgi:SAM-dependent methyltransferase